MVEQRRDRTENQPRPGQAASGSSAGGQQSGQAGAASRTPASDRGPVRLVSSQQSPEAQQAADHIGQMAEQLKDQGQQAVESLTDQFRQQAITQVHSQKDMAADSLHSVATAVRQTGQTLRQQGQTSVAEYADRGAAQIDHLSGYLRQHSLDDLVGEVEHFARRQPVAFLGMSFGLGFLASRFFKSSTPPQRMESGYQSGSAAQLSSMQSFEKAVDVNAPIQAVYGQWTQFEEFPRFMEGVEQVRQMDEKTLHWRAKIAGKVQEWDAVIVEQVPDQKISWRSINGAHNFGRVTFEVVNPMTTRVTLWLEYQPEGMVENAGSLLGMVQGRVEGDLSRFKQFIESRGTATGAWRGEIHNENVTKP